MVFEDSFTVLSFNPTFKVELYIKEEIETALWWNSNLFIVTQYDIQCIFPIENKYDYVTIASFDVSKFGNFAKGNQDDSMDPIPQLR
jgi:hypothetical protein